MRLALLETKIKIVAIVAFLFFANFAAASTDCQEDYFISANTVFEKIKISDLCYLKVSPIKTIGLEYRQYYFFGDGKVLIFNSFGTGDSQQTGARTFMFLPAQRTPFFLKIQNQFWVHGPSQYLNLQFDDILSHPSSAQGGEIEVDTEISPRNNGGLEFKKLNATYLDFGFRLGSDPASDPRGRATLKDPAGRTCVLKNNQVLTHNSEGDYRLKFTAKQLRARLNKLCPRLDLHQLDEI